VPEGNSVGGINSRHGTITPSAKESVMRAVTIGHDRFASAQLI